MAEENGGTGPGEQYPGLNEQVVAAIREALAAGYALQPPPPAVTPFMTITPKLGLKQPALDDPALVTDLNDNFAILDESITATAAATLTNKTLTAPIITNPTITGWTNAQHSHLDAAGAGQLDGAAIVAGDIGTGFLVRESHVTDSIQDIFTSGGQDLVAPDLIDAVVRDTLWWGPTPTGAADVSLQRTGAGSLRQQGARVQTEYRLTGGTASAHVGQVAGGALATLAANAWFDGTNWVRDDVAKGASWLNSDPTEPLAVVGAPAGANPIAAGDIKALLTLSKEGNLGLGVVPLPVWPGNIRAVQLGRDTVLAGWTSATQAIWSSNSYFTDTWRAITVNPAIQVTLAAGNLAIANSPPPAAAGDAITLTQCFGIDLDGTVTVTPDAGKPALVTSGTIHANVPVAQQAPWWVACGALQVGGYGAIQSDHTHGGAPVSVYANTWRDASGIEKAIAAGTGGRYTMSSGYHQWGTAASVAAGAALAFNNKMELYPTGQLNVTPNQDTVALYLNTGAAGQPASGNYRVFAMGTWWHRMWGTPNAEYHYAIGRDYAPAGSVLFLDPVNAQSGILGHWVPASDGGGYLGVTAKRWLAVYSQNGTIQTSTFEMKEDFGPLDPMACAQAVLGTDWVEFRYRPPAYPYTDSDEAPEDKDPVLWRETLDQTRVAHAKHVAEAAPSRHQKGYVLQSPAHKTHDLFGLDDRENTSVASDLAVVACALQGALRDIADLKAQLAQAPTGTSTSRRSRAA